jgi:LacI family transcriptional regulator
MDPKAACVDRSGLTDGHFCDAPRMAVTSKDIAGELGISQSTVSRALRGDPRVAASTLTRVLDAAQRLNYTPNLAARSLITRKTRTIGVVVSDITNPFYPELLDILHNEFALASYRTILLNERTDVHLEQHVAELVNGGAVDGLVYVSAVLGMPLPGRGASARPVVLLNREICSAAVAQALVDLGHRRIALIAGPENTSTSKDREVGFTEQLRALGAPLDERLRRVGQFSHKSGYQWCLDLLAADERPTALFAANDVIAFGALDAARRLRVRVPEELSVVGFDDIDMASWEGFNLTTARQPLAEMARTAARLLLERIESEEPLAPRRRVFPVKLVHRSTLAAAASG